MTALAALVLLALLGTLVPGLVVPRPDGAALRVTVGGGLAMALSVLIGQLVGTTGR